MSAGKYVTKRVRVDANSITLGIINHLNSNGHKASRINTTGIFVEANEYHPRWHSFSHMIPILKAFGLIVGWWRKSGADDGASDVISCIRSRRHEMSGYDDILGLFVGWEVKFGKDRMRPSQIRWADEVRKAGGRVYTIHSYEEYLQIYETQIKPML